MKQTPTDAIKKLLSQGTIGSQEELCQRLNKMGHDVTQSTVSRALKKLGAYKTTDEKGKSIYRLPDRDAPPSVASALTDLVISMENNGSIIVIQTKPGSASLIARHIDYNPGTILGTIAGDDTIFVAPKDSKKIKETLEHIEKILS